MLSMWFHISNENLTTSTYASLSQRNAHKCKYCESVILKHWPWQTLMTHTNYFLLVTATSATLNSPREHIYRHTQYLFTKVFGRNALNVISHLQWKLSCKHMCEFAAKECSRVWTLWLRQLIFLKNTRPFTAVSTELKTKQKTNCTC